MTKPMTKLHATAVALDGQGVLIQGPSGRGKSDLALRLIEGGADLIADDWVEIERDGEACRLFAPETLRGLIEVRGQGIVEIGAVQDIPLCLIIELKPRDEIERMPEAQEKLIEGIAFPVIEIDAFEVSAPAKIKMALRIQNGKASLIE